MRLADWHVTSTGYGIVGMITKNTYINTSAFRGLRKTLQSNYDGVSVLDLHGKLYEKGPPGTSDNNVFEIRVGVAILLAVRASGAPAETFRHLDFYGPGEDKVHRLSALQPGATPWTLVPIDRAQWTLEPRARNNEDRLAADEYDSFVPLLELAVGNHPERSQGESWGGGVKTNRDYLLVAFTRAELERRLEILESADLSVDQIKLQLGLADGPYWNTERERAKLQRLDWRSRIFPYLYGPFDVRYVAHIPSLIEIGRGGASKHLMRHFQVTENVGMVLSDETWMRTITTRSSRDIPSTLTVSAGRHT